MNITGVGPSYRTIQALCPSLLTTKAADRLHATGQMHDALVRLVGGEVDDVAGCTLQEQKPTGRTVNAVTFVRVDNPGRVKLIAADLFLPSGMRFAMGEPPFLATAVDLLAPFRSTETLRELPLLEQGGVLTYFPVARNEWVEMPDRKGNGQRCQGPGIV